MRLLLTLGLLICLVAACGPSDTDTAPSASSYHETEGTVHSITSDRSFMRIDHERIPGHMDAMVMPFAVEDTSLIAGIESGDRVMFAFDDSEGVAKLVEISRIEE